jgi:hypothetical protein
MDYISVNACLHGHLYRISSRNLALGVFRAWDRGFIGIREKFGNRFLSTEYHCDVGPPLGTVHPLEDLGPVPNFLELRETLSIPNEHLMLLLAFKAAEQAACEQRGVGG